GAPRPPADALPHARPAAHLVRGQAEGRPLLVLLLGVSDGGGGRGGPDRRRDGAALGDVPARIVPRQLVQPLPQPTLQSRPLLGTAGPLDELPAKVGRGGDPRETPRRPGPRRVSPSALRCLRGLGG